MADQPNNTMHYDTNDHEAQANQASQPERGEAAGVAPAAEQAASGEAVDVAALQARIAALEQEVAEYKDNWLRAAADYKNFKRRSDQERADLIRNASAGMLLKLLPVIDDVQRAMSSVPQEVADTPWYEGFKLIVQKLQAILESEGVTPIEAVGQEFDPNLHEAVIFEEGSDGQTNKVVAELQTGYRLRDRVLRPAMVKVARG